MNRAIVRSLVGGHGGACAEDGSTINGANNAARSEDVREVICGVWWRLVGVMVGGGRHGCFGGGWSSRGIRALRERRGKLRNMNRSELF